VGLAYFLIAPVSEQENMNLVGPQVRKIRELQKLTQEALVTRCHILKWNISRSTLAKIESQVRRVTDEEVARLAQVLEVGISELYQR